MKSARLAWSDVIGPLTVTKLNPFCDSAVINVIVDVFILIDRYHISARNGFFAARA